MNKNKLPTLYWIAFPLLLLVGRPYAVYGGGPVGGSLNYIVEQEANDTVATAQPVAGRILKIKGNIQRGTDVDYYSFKGTAGDRLYAATQTSFSAGTGLSGDTTIEVYAPDGVTLLEADDEDGAFSSLAASVAGVALATTADYFIKVRHTSAPPTTEICPYDLYLRLQNGTPTLESEPNNDDGTPNPLPSSGWVRGTITVGDNDTYSVALNAGDTVFLSVDADPERNALNFDAVLSFGIFDNNFLQAQGSGAAGPNSEAFFFTVRDAGNYVVRVHDFGGGGGPNATYALSVSVYPPETLRTCMTYTSTDVPKAIPLAAGLVSSTVNIPDSKTIGNLKLNLNITHSVLSELDVSLVAPAGNEVVLFDDPLIAVAGTTPPQMGFGLDDEAGLSIGIFGVHKAMIYQPEGTGRLYWFKGQNTLGTWKLNIRDDAGAGSGTLHGWSITACADPFLNCQTPQTVFSADFEGGAAGFTHSGTADEWERGLPSFAPITTCHSGTNCWKTDLDNTYNNAPLYGTVNQELLSPNINLTTYGGRRINLEWAMQYQLDGSNFDNAFVEVREVGGAGLIKRVWEWAGPPMTRSVGNPLVTIQSAAGWGVWQADISEFAGKTIAVAFHLDENDTVALAGLAIDDVKVKVCNPVTAVDAVSRKLHGLNPFNVDLPLTGPAGVECRTGGATRDFQMVVNFGNPVTVNGNPQADVTSGVGDVGTGGVPNGGAVTVNGTHVTIPLTNVTNAQVIVVTLFNVSDGINGLANVAVPMGILNGDTTGNGSVNASDVSQTKSKSGQAVSATNFRTDVTVSNSINASDVSFVKSKSGTALPP
jgi:subtilisin-like proprotein convertase family protein